MAWGRCFLCCCGDPPEELDVVMDFWQTAGDAYRRYHYEDPSREDEELAETLVQDHRDITITPEWSFGYPPRDEEENPFGKLLNDTFRVTLVPDPWEGESEDAVFEWFSDPDYREGTPPPSWPYRQVYRLGAGKDHFYISAHGPGASDPYYTLVLRLRLDTEHESAVLLVYRNAELPEGDDASVIRALNSLNPECIQAVFVQRMKRGDYGMKVTDATNQEPVEMKVFGPLDKTIDATTDGHAGDMQAPQDGSIIGIKYVLGNTAPNGELRKPFRHETDKTRFTIKDESDVDIAGNGTYRGGGLVKIVDPVTSEMTSASLVVSSVSLEAPHENELVVEGREPNAVPKRLKIAGVTGVRADGCWDGYFAGEVYKLRNSQGEVRLVKETRCSTIAPKFGEITNVTGGEVLEFTPVEETLTLELPEKPKWRFVDLFDFGSGGPFERGSQTEAEYESLISGELNLPSIGISVSVTYDGDTDHIVFSYDDPEAAFWGPADEVGIGIFKPIIVTTFADHKLVSGEQVIFGSGYPEAEGNLSDPLYAYTHLPASVSGVITGTTAIEDAWYEDATVPASVQVIDDTHFSIGEHYLPIVYAVAEDPDPEDEFDSLNVQFRLSKTKTVAIFDFQRHDGQVLMVVSHGSGLRSGVYVHLDEGTDSDWGKIVKGRCQITGEIEQEDPGQELTHGPGASATSFIFDMVHPWSWDGGATVLAPGTSTALEVESAFEAAFDVTLVGDAPEVEDLGGGTYRYTLYNDDTFVVGTYDYLQYDGTETPGGFLVDRAPPELPLITVVDGSWKGSGQCGHSEWFGTEDHEPFHMTHCLGYATGSSDPVILPPEARPNRATVQIKLPPA